MGGLKPVTSYRRWYDYTSWAGQGHGKKLTFFILCFLSIDSEISIHMMLECLDYPFELVSWILAIDGWVYLIWKINGPFIVRWMIIEVFLLFGCLYGEWRSLEVVWLKMGLKGMNSRKLDFVTGARIRSTGPLLGRPATLKTEKNRSRLIFLRITQSSVPGQPDPVQVDWWHWKFRKYKPQLFFWGILQSQCVQSTGPVLGRLDTQETEVLTGTRNFLTDPKFSVRGRLDPIPVDRTNWKSQRLRMAYNVFDSGSLCTQSTGWPLGRLDTLEKFRVQARSQSLFSV